MMSFLSDFKSRLLSKSGNREEMDNYRLISILHVNRWESRIIYTTFDNIYSLFKQNIKSCNAKRRRHATPKNDEKQQ